MNCQQARDEMAAAGLGQSSPGEMHELEEHAATCADCRSEFETAGAALSRYRRAGFAGFEISSALADRVMSAVASCPAPGRPDFVERVRLWGAVAGIAACAGIVLFAIAYTLVGESGGSDVRATLVYGDRVLVRDRHGSEWPLGGENASRVRTAFVPASFRVESPARFELPGGIAIAVRDASIRLGKSSVLLESGRLSASVPPGTAFFVETHDARVEVTGTVFHVEAGDRSARTLVSVDRGSVKVSSGQQSADIPAGQSVAAGLDAVTTAQHHADPGLNALILSRDLYLEAKLIPDSDPPGLELLLHNISAAPVLLPNQGTDKPRFSVKFCSISSGFEGVANLPKSQVKFIDGRGRIVSKPGSALVELEPGEAISLRFDLSSIMSEPGEYQVFGVFQSTPPVMRGAWIGQAVSGPLDVRVGRR